MAIRIQCSGCKKTLAVKDTLAGKRVACPVCKTSVQVPGSAAPLPVRPKGPTADELENMAAESLGGGGAQPEAPVEAAATNGQASTKPPIVFNCTYCEAELKADYEQAGKQMPCPECSRVVKIPMPKEEKPKDWRTVQKAGPSMAASNQPEKLDNAWGTEGTKKVSQAALVEAGVVAKPVVRKAPLADRVASWIKRGVVAGIVLGVAVWLYSIKGARNDTVEAGKFEKQFQSEWSKKWPPLQQAEFHLAMGRRKLLLPKGGEPALESWTLARMKALEADKIDRDLFLGRLAVEQVRLGGEDLAIRSKERFDWVNEVFRELQRTLSQISSPEARVIAIRDLAAALAEHKKTELLTGLVSGLIDEKDARELVKTQQVALLLGDGKAEEAAAILPAPDPARGQVELPSRIAYAEGLARQAKATEAISLADSKGVAAHRFEALAAVAALLAQNPQANDALLQCLAAAQAILDKELAKDQTLSPWVHLQYIRLVAKAKGEEAAKPLLGRLKEKAFVRRAELELALAMFDKAPPMEAATARIELLEPEYRALAWLALAQAHQRERKSFAGPPDDDDHQACRFLCAVARTP